MGSWHTRAMQVRVWLPWMVVAMTSLNAKAADPAPVFEARPCPAAPANATLRCGIVRVPERTAAPTGRQIELHVLVLPATDGRRRDVAQYDLEGGPGFAVTDFLEFYLGEGAPYRRSRDIVLADRRGTGQSGPLRCPALEDYARNTHPAPLYPPDLVADCHKALSTRADLAAYSTGAAAQDIDLVRRALGYERLDLNAVSYGTTLAWRYIAEFPQRVQAAVFMGTVPADRTPPRFHATAAERALSLLEADCARDTSCAAAFGSLAADVASARRQFNGADAALQRDMFMERLRSLMYTTAGQRNVPLLLHDAARGDFTRFDAATRPGGSRSFADGLYLTLTCSESFGQFDVDAAALAARQTRFGDYRLARQRVACEHWPVGAAEPDAIKLGGPFKVPVLLLAGEMDPVSPPEWATHALAAFPQGRLLLMARGGHVPDGLSGLDTCFDRVVIDFIAQGSARDLDTACFAQMVPGPYQINSTRH